MYRETLINNFLKISSIPRGSGNEKEIADFFVNVAKENNLYFYKDEYNNVLIKKNGNIAGEPVAFQAHLDMVCAKTQNSMHDFIKDGIDVIIDGDKVTAKDTSLGADQGVGLSMMLVLMADKNLNHPNLEFLFTTEEETTFNGAVNFPYEKVESKRMINLDNSNDSMVYIGADGDVFNEYFFSSIKEKNDLPSYKISMSGLLGGNSGENIELSKNNAITTMAKILNGKNILLNSINGGTFENDVATSCEVIINTNEDIYDIFKGLEVEIRKVDNKECFNSEDTKNIINQILQLKSGIVTENGASANLGVIKTIDNEVVIDYIFRSMKDKELEEISSKTRNLSNKFDVKEIYTDPIWKINKNSEILEKYKQVYYNEYGEYPSLEICKGSIECATIKNHINDLDVISIGANMQYFHTPDEVTYISSWCKIYNLVIKLLEIV